MGTTGVIGVIQVRCSSSRLPNKSLMPLMDMPVFEHVYRRAVRSTIFDNVIIATSVDRSDDRLVNLCSMKKIPIYRGSLEDVLSRYYRIAKAFNAEHIVRLTGDCPLLDTGVIEEVVVRHLLHDNDYTSNVIKPTYPDGLDAEAMTKEALTRVHLTAVDPVDREHVTQMIMKNQDRYICENVAQKKDHSNLRWSIDHQEDYDFVKAVYEHLYDKQKPDDTGYKYFGMDAVLKLIKKRPEIVQNANHLRNEGLIISEQKDSRDGGGDSRVCNGAELRG